MFRSPAGCISGRPTGSRSGPRPSRSSRATSRSGAAGRWAPTSRRVPRRPGRERDPGRDGARLLPDQPGLGFARVPGPQPRAPGRRDPRCDALGVPAVVVHPGAHMGAGEEAGLRAVARSLDEVHERTRGARVRTLLEVTAGQGSCLGHRFEHLAAVLSLREGPRTAGRLPRHLPPVRRRLRHRAPPRLRGDDGGLRARGGAAPAARPCTSTTPRRGWAAAWTGTPAPARATLGLPAFRRIVNDPRLRAAPHGGGDARPASRVEEGDGAAARPGGGRRAATAPPGPGAAPDRPRLVSPEALSARVKALARDGGLRPRRYRLRRRPPRAGVLRRLDRARVRRRDGVPHVPGGAPQRPARGASLGPVGRLRSACSTTRRAPYSTEAAAEQRLDRALRMGRRLPRRDEGDAGAAGGGAGSARWARCASRVYVDTGPIVERAYAAAAGLGAWGKNTLPAPSRARLVVLPGRDRHRPRAAGGRARARTCAAPAPPASTPVPPAPCPRPYVLDATRCISYLTIELKGDDPGRPARGRRPPRLRLRHLPGRVSLEPSGAAPRRRAVRARGRA